MAPCQCERFQGGQEAESILASPECEREGGRERGREGGREGETEEEQKMHRGNCKGDGCAM
jgi:hypothetical protein